MDNTMQRLIEAVKRDKESIKTLEELKAKQKQLRDELSDIDNKIFHLDENFSFRSFWRDECHNIREEIEKNLTETE